MQTIIGERINATRPAIRKAIDTRDAAHIADEAARQKEAGATHIDVNASAGSGREQEDMAWLISVVQDRVDIPLCLDSPHVDVLEASLSMVTHSPIVNSISLEKGRFLPMLELVQGRSLSVVALCMSDDGLPRGAGDVVNRAEELVDALEGVGIARGKIYVDILIQPIATSTSSGRNALDAVRGVKAALAGVHVVCGLSNVSFGMPKRTAINQGFLSMLMASGLDAVILDPLNTGIMSELTVAKMLLGQDPYCLEYIRATEAGYIV